jgi:hypothetical protein
MGSPDETDCDSIARLADAIAAKHAELGVLGMRD